MSPANLLLQSVIDWMQILPVVARYDAEEYTTERSLELNSSLEETLRRATLAAQFIRSQEASLDPQLYAELQRLADALVTMISSLRRFPSVEAPPRPVAGDVLRLITPSIQNWLGSEADVNLLAQLR